MPSIKKVRKWFKKKFRSQLIGDLEVAHKCPRLPGLDNKLIAADLITVKEVRVRGGTFSETYYARLATYRGAPRTVQVKQLRGQSAFEDTINESLILKGLIHAHVITFIGIHIRNDFPHIVLPFMANGDLQSFLKDEGNILTNDDLLQFAIDIAKGMEYVSSQNIVHRDLATRNCHVDRDLRVKIADFRIARRVDSPNGRASGAMPMLPVRWMAPESMEYQIFDQKTDVWSFGVTFWEIMTRGVVPYIGYSSNQVPEYVLNGGHLSHPSFCSDRLYNIILKCTNMVPASRPTFTDLLDILPYKPDGVIHL
ncbi:Tyrosine-protein kinase receptor TYRO3 [Halotydeus destructor]|nr:Tyrosine-protein kinase receptor TYRO3 [Halotydeus destructor]